MLRLREKGNTQHIVTMARLTRKDRICRQLSRVCGIPWHQLRVLDLQELAHEYGEFRAISQEIEKYEAMIAALGE